MRETRLSTLMGAALAPLLLTACGSDAGDTSDGTPAPTLGEVAANEAIVRAEERAERDRPRSFIKTEVGPGELTPEVIHTQALSGTPLRNVAISPDGARITYLQGSEDDPDQLDLWAYDSGTGEAALLVSSLDLIGEPVELSEEEKNRRERAREYGRGIISYSWVDADTLLFPLGGDVYLYDIPSQEARQVTATEGFESDIKLSDDKRFVAYVRDDELFVTDLDSGLERQLTSGATETVRNAVASFVVQEELARSTGYWLSPDGTRVAYTQIDESPIAVESRIDMGPDGLRTIDQRYPFAGTDNAKVRLGFTPNGSSRGRGRTVWADIPGWDTEDDIYLTRVAWAPDNRHAYAGILSRDHKTHTVYRVDSRDGSAEVFYEETSPTWLNIRSDLAPTEDGFKMVSERDGIRRYYAVTADGAEPLTPEGLLVTRVNCESDDGTLYVTGWDEDPLTGSLYRVTPVGAPETTETEETDADNATAPEASPAFALQRLSPAGKGSWSARFAEDCSRYVGYASSPNQPPQSAVYSNTGERLFWLNENAVTGDHPFAPYAANAVIPERGTLPASDGTELHYELYKPRDLRPGERRPSVTIVYGGPGVQRVHGRWDRRELARMLAAHGFVVFKLDGRGASNRGKAFEDHLYRAMGKIEVEDQLTGAEWLKARDFIDPDRMGVYGWSYGGYMALHMLAQTDAYAAGVSGAPVTDWTLYDTAYTERYLGDPRPDNANYTEGAYETSNVMAHIEGLTEPVLVIHGMADDNVVFRHTVMLADAMVEAGQTNLSVMPYPGEKHGFRAESARIHRDQSILDFFSDKLAPDVGREN